MILEILLTFFGIFGIWYLWLNLFCPKEAALLDVNIEFYYLVGIHYVKFVFTGKHFVVEQTAKDGTKLKEVKIPWTS